MDNEKHKTLTSAAEFFQDIAKELLKSEKGLHVETLISSIARMAGSLMYRSFGADQKIEPGTVVLSDKANIYGPKLMNMMLVTLQQQGHKIGEENINREYTSSKHSLLSFKESHNQLAAFFLKYCEITSISHHDAAFGAAIATGMIIHECREIISIEKGAGIAVYGLVEGTKTAPFPPTID